MRIRVFIVTFAILGAGALTAQQPRTHRLEATPATVAYGHYWSETKPVLTINSGDIIDVDTLLTSTPDRLEKAGVPAAEIQQSLRDIVSQVKDRGPGGHILTGPVYVNGAEPGDALEVKVLSIDLPIDYGAWISPDTGTGEPPILEGSPAAEAGLEAGDILTAINGARIDASQNLDEILSSYKPGEILTVEVLRAGETLQISLTLGTRPAGLE